MSLGIVIIAALVAIIVTIASIISLAFWLWKEKKLRKTGTPKEKILIAAVLVLWLVSLGIGTSSPEVFLPLLAVSVVAVSVWYFYSRRRKGI